MKDFNDWINHHNLVDLPLHGVEFTWSNMQKDPVICHLDRFLVSTDWVDLFPDCIQRALARPISNHCSLMLETGLEDWGPPFRFEVMWLSKNGFTNCVKEWWSSFSVEGWMGFLLARKLKFLKKRLQSWKKEDFGNLTLKKYQLLADIQNLDVKEEVGKLEEEDRLRRSSLQEELRRLIFQKEIKWKQRSRNKWLEAGDRNTKFFHAIANSRRCLNRINVISAGHLGE